MMAVSGRLVSALAAARLGGAAGWRRRRPCNSLASAADAGQPTRTLRNADKAPGPSRLPLRMRISFETGVEMSLALAATYRSQESSCPGLPGGRCLSSPAAMPGDAMLDLDQAQRKGEPWPLGC